MLKKLLFTIILNAFALFFVQYFMGENIFLITDTVPIFGYHIWSFCAVGIVMGVLNFIVKPILSLLSLPLVFITFGLFLTLISMFMLYLNEYIFQSILTPEIVGITFVISGGWVSYLFASLLLSFFNTVLHFFIKK